MKLWQTIARNPVATGLVLGGAAAAVGVRSLVGRGSLRGKVVAIMGASRGLGLALSREFARKGCKLVLVARSETELEQAGAELAWDGAEVMIARCDVTNRVEVDDVVEAATLRFGGIDVLVNVAGIMEVAPLETTTDTDFAEALAVMLWGAYHPTMAVLPHMRARGEGRIVNITSIGGKIAVPHLVPYSTAKFALVGLSEGLRAELAQDGVKVTTVVPGLMRTGSYVNAFFKGEQKKEYAWFALGATLPGLSMSADRAARQIVRATERGDAEVILTLPAKIAARVHGIAPSFTVKLLELVGRMLPRPDVPTHAMARGAQLDEQYGESKVFRALTALGMGAQERFHQRVAG